MDIVIKIGRGAKGADTHYVPSSFKRVSRDHAIFHWQNGIATLEDNGSTNGTFVNGSRITRTQVLENDIVWLGGLGPNDQCYRLDLSEIFASCRNKEHQRIENIDRYPANADPRSKQASGIYSVPSESGNERTDYTHEFAHLKKTYIDYHAQMSKLTKKANKQTQLPRVLLSMIPAVLGLVIMLVSTDMTMRIVGMTAGSVLSGLIGVLTMGSGSSKKEKLNEDILDLQLKYKKEYKCPKCGKEFDLDLHYKKLQSDGTCPFGCGARFV